MKNISFALTAGQFRKRTKTVTRRLAWESLRPGEILMGCVKCRGIKAGLLERLGPIRVVSVTREPLDAITCDEVRLEGFKMTPAEFVRMFIDHHGRKVNPQTVVTRIAFEYLDAKLNGGPLNDNH